MSQVATVSPPLDPREGPAAGGRGEWTHEDPVVPGQVAEDLPAVGEGDQPEAERPFVFERQPALLPLRYTGHHRDPPAALGYVVAHR